MIVRSVSEAFHPYVLEVPADTEEDGSLLAVVLVVIKKPSAVLLAVPEGFFEDSALLEGMDAGPEDMLGPSKVVSVPAGRLDQMDGSPPVAEAGAMMTAVLVDMTQGVLEHLSLVSDYGGPPEVLHLLDPDPFLFPMRDELVAAAWDWLVQPDAGERIHYYSAAEELEEEDPDAELVPDASEQRQVGDSIPPGRRRGARPTDSGQNPKPAAQPKIKRPTVASLAASFESVAAALPMLTSQIQELTSRTKAMEEKMTEPTRTLALTKPLGDSTMRGSSGRPSVSPQDLLKEMPPPSAAAKVKPVPVPPTFPEAETLALEGERIAVGDQGEILKAMFAQSSAVTALAAQIANIGGDSLGDLAGSMTTFSSKGASGRMKLQQELAMHKGTFFTAVLANMSRRMNPASSSSATPQQLMTQGVSLTRYVERFGGFGRQKDMGYIMWQVAMIMDYLQSENWEGARDASALLAVCLEQTALDSSMDVGLLLSLTEDPPSGLFTNRSLAPLSRGRAFAPLADQRWITTALSFIKELDLIAQRRSDLVTGKGGASSTDLAPTSKPKAKPPAKAAAWKKKRQKALEDHVEET